jgi:hypothetical protein
MYPLLISLAAAIAMLALVVFVFGLGRRIADGGVSGPAGWRWYPSWAGMLVLLPIAAFLAWRFSPALLFIPIIFPLFRRSFRFRNGQRDDGTIEGDYRRVDKG